MKRLITGFLSAICVVVLVMGLVYVSSDSNSVFAGDQIYSKLSGESKEIYKYRTLEVYGYCNYVNYYEYKAKNVGASVKDFVETYLEKGYTIKNFDIKNCNSVDSKNNTESIKSKKNSSSVDSFAPANDGSIFAYKDISIGKRLVNFFANLIWIDTPEYIENYDGERELSFTLHDPVYSGAFSPAVLGEGTYHRYLLYFDNKFPFVHQNWINLNLGRSCAVNIGEDVWQTMNETQGDYVYKETVYPTSYIEISADDLHSAVYSAGSALTNFNRIRFNSDYTIVKTDKTGMSKLGYSFFIGAIAVIIAYLAGILIGLLMVKFKPVDKMGTMYILFITAVPSLAYIFFFKALGRLAGLPASFDLSNISSTMYILPILSIALPQMAEHMKWCRRYVTDQKRSTYVQFARSLGFSEKQIFSEHILINALVPLVQGIPAGLLGALGGAIITERVYSVPGVGSVLTTAINSYDNAVIVGVAFFYALISVLASILGDWLMTKMDPRIRFE